MSCPIYDYGMTDDSTTPDLEFHDRPISRKAVSALSLRVAGASLDEIVRVVGFASRQEAVNAIDKALKDEFRSDPKAREKARQVADRRLESLLRSVWSKAINPDHPEQLMAVGKAKELIDRHIKLLGLDAPSQMVVHNPDAGEIERWVMQVMAQGAPEMDDFDVLGEVVEGEVSEDGDDEDPPFGVLASA